MWDNSKTSVAEPVRLAIGNEPGDRGGSGCDPSGASVADQDVRLW
jgi:hypothetical protein